MPYIAKGSYGCVFAPNLKCMDKDMPSDVIGKVFRDTIAMTEEKALSEQVKKIDPQGKWTVPYYGSCPTDIKQALPSDNVHACSHTKRLSKTEQLLYQNGGIDLMNVVREFGMLKDVFIDDFIPMMLPLLEGLVSLDKKRMVHCDIKPVNMLYNGQSKKLFIIDFGLLMPYKDIANKNKDFILSWTYPYYPPEFYMYSHLILHNRAERIRPIDIYSNFDSFNTNFLNFMLPYIDIEDEINSFLNDYKNNRKEFKRKFNTEYVSKIDVYSLGISFVEIFYMLSKNGMKQFRNKALFDDFMEHVIVPMIQQHADKRINAQSACEALEKVLRKYSKQVVRSPKKKTVNKVITSPYIPSPTNDCMKLKRTFIVDMLKQRGKPTYGNKTVLCKRLEDAKTVVVEPPPKTMTQEECEGLKV